MKHILPFLLIFLISDASASANRWEGQPFAQFELSDQNGQTKNNSDFKGKWAIIYFYPKDRTPGCTVEAQNFVDDYAKYQASNIEIVGVSYDDIESHKDFSDTYDMKFTLLADVDKKLSKAMDVDRILPWPHPSRQTFVVDPAGTIVKHYQDVKPKSHSQELLKDVQALISQKMK
ncbi:MAG: peroxiredoxin [Kangiellaceae bacterium]|nr:peroxiredoxin [Kangiellaceae bacterium]